MNLENLRELRKLLAKPERWIRTHYARDAEGRPVGSCDPSATSWCLVGGWHRVTAKYYGDELEYQDENLYDLFKRHGIRSPSSFNDTSTHAEVIAELDKIIAAEERLMS